MGRKSVAGGQREVTERDQVRSRNQSQKRGRKRLAGSAKSCSIIKASGPGDWRVRLWSREYRGIRKSR